MSRKLILFGAFSLAWFLATKSQTVSYFISSPYDTALYFYNHFDVLAHSFTVTAVETIIGLTIALVVSYAAVISSCYYAAVYNLMRPLFVISQVLPIITLAPLFILIFGMGYLSKIMMVFLMCFFPIYIGTMDGVADVKRKMGDFLAVYGASKPFRIFRVYLPLSLPQTFTGIKLAVTMAVLGAIVAEFLGATAGLGKNLYTAPKNSNAELGVISAILTALMGLLLFQLVVRTRRRVVHWEKGEEL